MQHAVQDCATVCVQYLFAARAGMAVTNHARDVGLVLFELRHHVFTFGQLTDGGRHRSVKFLNYSFLAILLIPTLEHMALHTRKVCN